MLLANAAAARLVSAAFPERAMLRCHPPPNERKLADLEQFAREQGLEVDASSAAALHRSLARLRESHRDGYEIVQLLATLPMQLARYFSTGAQDRDTWGHYALAAPRYTHFTSPIRRYPDVLVHRQVAAALDAGFTPSGFRGGILGERGAAAPPRAARRRAAAAAAADAFGLPDSETLKAHARTATSASSPEGCAGRLVARLPVRTCAHRPRWRVGSCARRGASTCGCSSPPSGARRAAREGLRHVTATSAGPGAGADAVALAFEPTATPEDLRDGIRPGRGAGTRKRAMKASAARAAPTSTSRRRSTRRSATRRRPPPRHRVASARTTRTSSRAARLLAGSPRRFGRWSACVCCWGRPSRRGQSRR